MNIYEYQTFKISNITEANSVTKIFKKDKINLLHKYESIIWQGPHYIKILNEKLNKKKINYIVELRDNIGMIISLSNLNIKNMAITENMKKNILVKILSNTKSKKIKVFYTDKFKIEEKII